MPCLINTTETRNMVFQFYKYTKIEFKSIHVIKTISLQSSAKMCLLAYNIILSVKCNENDTHCLVSRKYYAPCLLSIMAKRSINSSSRNCHNSLVVQRTESKSLAEFICSMNNITIYLIDISISVNST